MKRSLNGWRLKIPSVEIQKTDEITRKHKMEMRLKLCYTIENCDEISKLIKAFPKDIAALDKRSVLAKVSSQESGR